MGLGVFRVDVLMNKDIESSNLLTHTLRLFIGLIILNFKFAKPVVLKIYNFLALFLKNLYNGFGLQWRNEL